MNYKVVIHTLGQLLKALSVILIFPFIVALIESEFSVQILLAFLGPSALCLGLGFILAHGKLKDSTFYTREGIVIVGFGWIIISLVGMLPFIIATAGVEELSDLSVIDWFFESVSGFSTTGASILHPVSGSHQIDIMYETGYKSVLFWRSLTHWVGGMGVLIFILAVIPSSAGASGIHLMQAESTGPTIDKLVSKMSSTARILYLMYAALTVLEIILLSLASIFDSKMNIFHAFVLSMGTAGTGGFAASSSSLGLYGPYVKIVVTVFMLLFGVNFNIYFCLLAKKFKDVLQSEELRFYLGFIIVAIFSMTLIVFYSMKDVFAEYSSFGDVAIDVSFTAVSLTTSTGYATKDFTIWPDICRYMLLLMMFIGACAGSTGGGFKCSRFLLLVKIALVRCYKVINPRGVYSVKMDGKRVADETIQGVSGYFAIYILILLLSILFVAIDLSVRGISDLVTAFSSVLTCLNNIGPGMAPAIGPSGTFFGFSIPIKLLLSVLMLLGRLEIYPILMLFFPKTYSRGI